MTQLLCQLSTIVCFIHHSIHLPGFTTQHNRYPVQICDLEQALALSISSFLLLRAWCFSCGAFYPHLSKVQTRHPHSFPKGDLVGSLYDALCSQWFPSSFLAYLVFLVLPTEAPTHRVAGAPLSHSGPTAGPSPRLFPRPLNISISQVGAGAHPVTAHPLFLSIFTRFWIFKFFPFFPPFVFLFLSSHHTCQL